MAPPPRPTRLEGLDLARGAGVVAVAVTAVVVGGTGDEVGPGLLSVLFSLVLGVAMGVRLDLRHPGVIPFLVANLVRGLLLVALGLVLSLLPSEVDAALGPLGLVVVVLAPLALVLHRAPVLVLGLATAAAVLGPLVTERAEGAGPGAPAGWLATGPYPLTTLLPAALAGLALASVARRAGRGPFGWGVAGVLALAAVAARLVGAGSTAEVVGRSMLAAAVVVAAFTVEDQVGHRRVARVLLQPVVGLGRLALSASVLLVLGLGAAEVEGGGWPARAVAAAVVLVACWALQRWWGTGPLEWLRRRLEPTVREGRHRAP